MDLDLSDKAWAEYRARIFQASGMVAAEADCSVTEALRLLRVHAEVERLSIVELSEAVVTRRIRLNESTAADS